MEIKQLKLVTGEEIICRVVDEDDVDIVIKDALLIVCRYTDDNNRYYSFRTFMTYQDDPDALVVIKANKLVGYCNPTNELIREFKIAIENLYEMAAVTNKVKNMLSSSLDSDKGNVVKLFGSDDNQIH